MSDIVQAVQFIILGVKPSGRDILIPVRLKGLKYKSEMSLTP
jgi:hypothetical protein